MPRSVHSDRYREFLVRLRRAREDSELTQVAVAKKLRRHQSWVSKSESGERRLDPVEFHELARLYGVSMDSFFD